MYQLYKNLFWVKVCFSLTDLIIYICLCRFSLIRVMVVLGAWKQSDWTPLSNL